MKGGGDGPQYELEGECGEEGAGSTNPTQAFHLRSKDRLRHAGDGG